MRCEDINTLSQYTLQRMLINAVFVHKIDFLIVKCGWTESRLSERGVRLSFLLPPAIIAFGIALPPLFFGMYNYSGSYACFIGTPLGLRGKPRGRLHSGPGCMGILGIFFGVQCSLRSNHHRICEHAHIFCLQSRAQGETPSTLCPQKFMCLQSY